MHRDGGVGRCVDADQLAAAQFVDLVVEEVDGAAQHCPLETRCAVHRCRDDDIGACGAEHRFGLVEGLPATPSLDQPRIAGLGERTVPEVGAEQHGVLVFPADPRLRLGQLEPVGNEFACVHVEFAHDRGVRSAARQADQRQRVIRLDDVGARPHPVRIVAAREFIDIDDDVPLRRLAAIALQRGSPPQPSRVGRVAPEVVEVLAAAPHVRDAGIGVEHLQRFGAHLLEPVAAQLGERGLVVLAHPVQRVVAGDVLEPQVGVVSHGNPFWRAGVV